MAEMFLQISVSLDGYIEDRKGDIEWMTSDTSLDTLATATLRSIDGMIFGRKAHVLLERGFVEEVRLIQYPVLLGGGTPLFADDGTRRDLKLIGSQRFESGATLQRYRFS